MSGLREVQVKVEKVIIEAILKPFYEKLTRCQSKSIDCEGEGQIEKVTI